MQKFLLPHDIYHRTQWYIRSYPRLKAEYDALLGLSAVDMDGMPKASDNSSTVENTASKRLKIREELDPITEPLKLIKPYYRDGILKSILYHEPYPLGEDDKGQNLKTWQMWRQRYIYYVACQLGWWEAGTWFQEGEIKQ